MAEKCPVCDSVTCMDHCFYCHEDISVVAHAPSCPSSTNLFPVQERDLGPACPNCGWKPGMGCTVCGAAFELGDTYTYRTITEGDGLSMETAPLVQAVCLTCAAFEREGTP